MKPITSLLAGALALTIALPTLAGQAYEGSFQDGQAIVDVTLTLADKGAMDAGSLAISKWACALKLDSPKPAGDALRYPIKEAGKGRCDPLINGDLLSRPDGDTLQVQLKTYKGTTMYSFTLTPR